jgi:outer membrane protein
LLVRIITFSLALALLGSLAPLDTAKAQTAAQAGPILAVLDIGKIRREAASVKSIREQIINHQNNIQGEIQKEQDALRTAQQELAKKQTLLAPEAFAEERKNFEQRVVGMQQMVQQRRRSLEEAQNKAMNEVEKALNEIVAKLAEKNDYDIIFRFSQVVYVKIQHDITGEVLKSLDQKLPTVQVDLPKN